MNNTSIFLYTISVAAWWAGFNYAATRTESPTRRKLLSTAAALALAWPAALIALAGALATKLAANLMITIGDHINNTWDAAISDEDRDITTTTGEEAHPALADNMPLMPPPPPPPATDEAEHDAPNRGNTGDNAETAEAADNDDSADDETVTIQKVTLADMI